MSQSVLFSRHDTPDIVDKLRSPHVGMSDSLCQEAADEIEALRELVRRKAQEILELRAEA